MKDQRKATETHAMDQVRRVQDILRRWNPIGLQPSELAPADEYDSYAPRIVSLVAQGCAVEQLAAHLERLRTDAMGLNASPASAAEVANEIVENLRPSSP